MRTEWVLEYADYVAAQKLFNRGSFGRRVYMLLILWILPIFALLLLLIMLLPIGTQGFTEDTHRGLVNIAPMLFFLAVARFSCWLALRRGYARLFLNGDPQKPVYMDLNEERVISGVPGSSEGKFYWNSLLKLAEDDKIALLYISKRLFLMIPKNKLVDDEWTAMKTLINSHLPGANKC